MTRPLALALALTLAPLVVAGCSPVADRCRADTLLVAVTLDDTSAAADSFAVSVAIDGAQSMQATIPHAAGAVHGNLVVTFPHGYPRGHTVGIQVDALAGGVVVGSGSASQPLAASCEVTPLSIAASAGGDLGVDDLSAGNDLTPPADLTSASPDLVCVPVAETGDACFDGIDNDCDGHTDCDDPDCTMAQCVPTPTAGFALGITVMTASFCPAMFTSQEVVNSGLTAASPACSTGACTCTGQMGCSGSFESYSGNQGCNGDQEMVTATAGCSNWNVNQTTTALMSAGIASGSGQCLHAGTSTKSAVSWTTSDRFCKTTAVGGGCAPGNVCVPKLSVPTCELADGNLACDSGYTASGGPWFNDFSDGRTCTCSCGAASGGACGTTYNVYSSSDCTGSPVLTTAANPSCTTVNGSSYKSTKISSTAPTCGAPTGTVGGTGLVGTGPKTLCCRP